MKREELFGLLDYFQSSNIAELSLKDGEFELSLSKVTEIAAATSIPSVVATAPVVHAEVPTVAEAVGEPINAPLVGTFYAAPSPESAPFVTVGSKVKKGEALCIVEAMKMLNELPAPYDCEILEIHAKNNDLVSYGQLLFSVQKTV